MGPRLGNGISSCLFAFLRGGVSLNPFCFLEKIFRFISIYKCRTMQWYYDLVLNTKQTNSRPVTGIDKIVSNRWLLHISGKISQTYLEYFEITHSKVKMKTNIRLWMYTPNGTVWYPFCLLWSSITCFRPENVSYKLPIHTSGKNTTVPRLFSDQLLQNENKHQTMNVHTKWNCLIPILSTLVKYYLFQAWKR